MILRLNELSPFKTGRIKNQDIFKDNHMYPRQFKNFIGRKVQIKFKDTASNIIFERMPLNSTKYPEFVGTPNEYDIWWRIVRMDAVQPYTCILIEDKGDLETWDYNKTIPRVIVCRSNKITDLSYYPNYVAAEDEIDINRQSDYQEYYLVSEETWEEFNEAYANDYIHEYPVQDTKIIGLTTYSQYPRNVEKLDFDDPIIPEEVKEWRDIAWNDTVDKEYGDTDIKYAERNKPIRKFAESYRNVPQRPINKGIVLRCDINAKGHPHFVVRENARYYDDKREIQFEEAYRYITEEDAIVYINTDEMDKNTKESVATSFNQEAQIWD